MTAEIFDAKQSTRRALQLWGRSVRKVVPRSEHGRWRCPPDRAEPLTVLRAQDAMRVQELVPIRYGRMLESPFTFFRGSAAVMAADLATMPVTGVRVQACGDAHLLNFGLYATPERRIVFDINDFDETLPGPWEWDLKRLTTSLVLEARDAGWGDGVGLDAVEAGVTRYIGVLRELVATTTLAIGYEQMNPKRYLDLFGDERTRPVLRRVLKRANKRTNEQAVRKWVRRVDGIPRFIEDPPVIEHLAPQTTDEFHVLLSRYRDTLQDNRRHLLHQYRFRDVVRKVVGVGSVGMRSYMILMEGRGPDDLLVLQAKEATSSVLTPHCGASGASRHGQRVVIGQRLMQAASDPFLGWAPFADRDFYVRQLRDHKGSSDRFGDKTTFPLDAQVLAGTLARAHARSVDPAVLIGYLGKGRQFRKAIRDFSRAYADQVEADFEHTTKSVQRSGLAVLRGV